MAETYSISFNLGITVVTLILLYELLSVISCSEKFFQDSILYRRFSLAAIALNKVYLQCYKVVYPVCDGMVELLSLYTLWIVMYAMLNNSL